MKIVLATLDTNISDKFSISLKDIFKTSNIDIVENYEELGNYLKEEISLFIIDNVLKFQGNPTQILSKFTKTNKDYIKKSTVNFILLSSDKNIFKGLAHFDNNVKLLHYGKSQQHNNSKIDSEINDLQSSKSLRIFIKSKQKIYLVHGFSGNQSTWNGLIKLINEDPDCKDLFEIDFYNYPTFTFSPLKLFKLFIPRKYDTISDNANSFDTKIRTDNASKFLIVGHSLGGLIIRELLINFYHANYRKKLDKVLLYAPAHNGSRLATYLGKLYRRNKHLKILTEKNNELLKLNQRWEDSHIEDKIYIKAIIGLRDKTVKKDNATYGLKAKNIDYFSGKNHLNIKNPGNKDSEIFKNFKQHLTRKHNA
jgi:hypothetical protein